VHDLRFQPRGPLRSSEAGPDRGPPRALAGGLRLPAGHGSVVGSSDGAHLLDLLGSELEGLNSRE
jgi:hypothetical protein